MPRKKKQTKSGRNTRTVTTEQSAFWPLAGGVGLIVLALLLLFGGFSTGGPLPKDLFHGDYWALGWGAYLAPIALVYWGVYKFISEDRQIPLDKLVSMLAVLLFASSFFYTSLVSRNSKGVYSGGHGGNVGRVIGNAVLRVLDRFPSSLIFLVLIVFAIFFAFGISPKVLLKIGRLFHNETDDTDLADLKSKPEGANFKLNEGVPVEHHSSSERVPQSSLRNTAQRLTGPESKDALTLASDPDWKFPSVDLLIQKQDKADAGNVSANAKIIQETLANFNIEVAMEGANIGPRVTQYTLKPSHGVKLTKITALENNLALDLAASNIRIEAPIPGKRAVGIEVPNVKPAMVRISSLLQSREWADLNSPLGITIGKDIVGTPVVASLDRMPHILIAGQTGSGKSIMINSVITSLLYRNNPSELKFILVDPKRVELAPYNDIPHLLTPVITEPEKCISALKWAVAEMDRRYKELAAATTRNIGEYNRQNSDTHMPYIVIVIDELADLMMMAARDVESLIVRIAQKARAVGIHLVLATQRPSVDVITGLIKANIPARVAFTTTSQVDSRTIIDQMGAEKLLSQGDMLYLTAEMPKPKRLQGAFISDEETAKITDFIRMQRPPQYDQEIISQPVQLNGRGGIVADYGNDVDDDLWRDAVHVVLEARKASTSLLQRRLRIGYGRAARLIETMEEQGIVGPADGSRPREVLVSSMDEVFSSDVNALHNDYEDNETDQETE
ncbi:MAG TPA: DNA translocase FtsK 4TM domain-containing protein [Candidatus Saccharimonadales bacterium]|jgi:S-DNA-T family DNA segregation ATPase FtsK/SpoIIIE|nr:DNA translocase FtsK 4TM domain-containing protein [Candidatus Saccharimonadales bacterium]